MTQVSDPAAAASDSASTTSNSNRVAAGIGLSRIAGLIREVLLGAILGTGVSADALRYALRIPNLIQNLLGEGSLSAAFVPVYSQSLQRAEDDPDGPDENEARQLASSVLGYGLGLVVFVVALIVLAARPLVWVMTLGGVDGERFEQTVDLTQIAALGVGILVMSAWCLGILNAHREYFASYAAPVAWNFVQITILIIAAVALDDDYPAIAKWVAIAMVIGAIAQVLVQLPKLRSVAGKIRPSLKRTYLVRDVAERMVPAIGARGVVQLSSYLDIMLTGLLMAGAASMLALALPLYILPISLFGFSVATSELTEMSRVATHDAAVVNRVQIGLRKVALAAGLFVPAFVFGGGTIADTLFRWPSELLGQGGVDADSAMVIGLTLGAFGLALPAVMTARISQNALYAMGDVRGPARIAVIRLVVLGVVAFLAMVQLDGLFYADGQLTETAAGFPNSSMFSPQSGREAPLGAHLGIVGIALGSVAASWAEWFLLRRRLSARLGERISSGLAIPIVAAGAVAAVVILAVRVLFNLPAPLEGIAIGLLGTAAYIYSLRLLGYRPRTPIGSLNDQANEAMVELHDSEVDGSV